MKFFNHSTRQFFERVVLLSLCVVFNLAAQPVPQGLPFYKGQGEIPNLSGFGNTGPGFVRGQPNPDNVLSINPQLTDGINEPHPFPDYIRKFGVEGNFPKLYRQLLKTEPVDHVQSRVFDESAFLRVRKIFVQEFENKTYAPNRDETAGHQVTVQMYKELRNSNKYLVVSAPIDDEDGYRLKMSADFSKARPDKKAGAESVSDSLLKEKDLGIVGNDVDAIMIGAVTKFLDHYTDNQGTRREAISSGIEFGSYLVNAKSGQVLWGARYVVSQDPDFMSFFKSGGRWLSKSELARSGMKKVLKVFYETQLR